MPRSWSDSSKNVLSLLLGIDSTVEQGSIPEIERMVFHVDAAVSKLLTRNDQFQIAIPAMDMVVGRREIEIASSEALGAVNFRVIGKFVIVQTQGGSMFLQENEAEVSRFKSCPLIVEYKFHAGVIRRLLKNITEKVRLSF